MRYRFSVALVVFALVVLTVVAPGIGLAAGQIGIQEGTFDVSQTTWDLSEDSPQVGPRGLPLGNDTSQSDPTCKNNPVNPAPNYEYVYKTFGSSTPLKAIEYDPLNLTGTNRFPVMILVHGGGWAQGCRLSMAGVAYDFASNDATLTYHYIAISIDYRLACDPNDPQVQGTQIARLCGWTFNTPDPTWSNAPHAAIHDVEDAVAWVTNWWQYHATAAPYWNGKVALVGGSAGGNLSLMAATVAPPGQAYRPNAVAGLSPFPRFTLMNDPYHTNVWGCDPPQSDDSLNCAQGKQNPQVPQYWEGGINRYLQCQIQPPPGPYYYDSSCLATYQAAASYDVVNIQGLLPPSTYQVNGGGPSSGLSLPELASLEAASDFDGILPVPTVHHHLCIVDSTMHATHLLTLNCDDPPTNTVRWNLVDWLGTNGICDMTHICSY